MEAVMKFKAPELTMALATAPRARVPEALDVSVSARIAGFDHPVMISREVFYEAVVWTSDDSQAQLPQALSLRLFAVLDAALKALRSSSNYQQLLQAGTWSLDMPFTVYRVPRDGESTAPAPYRCHIQIDGSPHGAPFGCISAG